MAQARRILEEALTLPATERAQLAASLIESLDAQEDADVEEAWRIEVARRVKELDDGLVETIDWAEARREILS